MLPGNVDNIRRRLYEGFRELRDVPQIEFATSLVAFQLRLADVIFDSESVARDPGTFDRNAFLLRRCQDALAFRLLAPHAIRQLLGSASPRTHSVSSQGVAFRATREAAARYATDNHLVLIADLSHIIRAGDLVLCDDPFIPSIVEVKSGEVSPQHIMQGRRGRQASRFIDTVNYLKNDYGKIFGEPLPKIAVQSKESMEFNWDAVNEVTEAALRNGTAVTRASDYDVFLSVFANESDSTVSIEPIRDDLRRFRMPHVASHAVSLLNPELLHRPPLVWPINAESTVHLMEENLILIHAIDIARFADPLEDDFRILEVSRDHGFSTQRGEERGSASARFIDEVVFGYATIESVVAALRELHDLLKSAFESGADEEPPKADAEGIIVAPLGGSGPIERPGVVVDTKGARYRIDR